MVFETILAKVLDPGQRQCFVYSLRHHQFYNDLFCLDFSTLSLLVSPEDDTNEPVSLQYILKFSESRHHLAVEFLVLKSHVFLVVYRFFKQPQALLDSVSFLTGSSGPFFYVLKVEVCTYMHKSSVPNNDAMISESEEVLALSCSYTASKWHGREVYPWELFLFSNSLNYSLTRDHGHTTTQISNHNAFENPSLTKCLPSVIEWVWKSLLKQ